MAKSKKSVVSDLETPKVKSNNLVSSILKDLSKKSETIVENSKNRLISKPFDSGVYMFNALLSKNIYGGFSGNRITILAGGNSTGKSYLAINAAKNAQKDGYTVILIDTEYAVELDDLEMRGMDISEDKFNLIRENVVEKISILLTQFLDQLKANKKEKPKILIVLDSLGMLASVKEKEDAIKGDNKQDMTRAKAIKRFFRLVSSDLGYLQIPMIITNHVYKDISAFFPQDIMGGGEGAGYAGSTIVFLSTAQLKTGEEDDMAISGSGVLITAKSKKNRIAIPKKIKMQLDFKHGLNPYSFLDAFCTKEHFEKVGVAKVKKEEDLDGNVKYVDYNKWYVKHLDKYVSEKNLFNGRVFNKTVLDALQPIILDYFSYSTFEELEKQFDNLIETDDIDSDENTISSDDDLGEFMEN